MESLSPSDKSAIRTEDIDLFLQEKLPKDSVESEAIVRDMVDNPDGFVWSYLQQLDQARAARLDALWDKAVGPERPYEDILKVIEQSKDTQE
jgi:hypothetical protein